MILYGMIIYFDIMWYSVAQWQSPHPSVRWIYARSAMPFAAWCAMKNTDPQVSKIKRGLGVEKECWSIPSNHIFILGMFPLPVEQWRRFSYKKWSLSLVTGNLGGAPAPQQILIIMWSSINIENMTALVSILKAHRMDLGWIQVSPIEKKSQVHN